MVKKHLDLSILQSVQAYKKALKSVLSIDKVIVFGSQAKGTAKSWSDIDVAVVSKKFGHDRIDEGVLLSRYADDIDLRIEPHPYHPDGLIDKYDPLAKEIRIYGVVI
jgi:predicted nucleotidyltransferase